MHKQNIQLLTALSLILSACAPAVASSPEREEPVATTRSLPTPRPRNSIDLVVTNTSEEGHYPLYLAHVTHASGNVDSDDRWAQRTVPENMDPGEQPDLCEDSEFQLRQLGWRVVLDAVDPTKVYIVHRASIKITTSTPDKGVELVDVPCLNKNTQN